MKTIWKFTLEPECTIEMPTGAEVLSVHSQKDAICLWAKVDPSAPKEPRRFIAFGTGHDIPDDPMTFVGTAHLDGGSLVFHIFERH